MDLDLNETNFEQSSETGGPGNNPTPTPENNPTPIPGNNVAADSENNDSEDDSTDFEQCRCGHEIGDNCPHCSHGDRDNFDGNPSLCCVCGGEHPDKVCAERDYDCECVFHEGCVAPGLDLSEPNSTEHTENIDVDPKRKFSDGETEQTSNKKTKT